MVWSPSIQNARILAIYRRISIKLCPDINATMQQTNFHRQTPPRFTELAGRSVLHECKHQYVRNKTILHIPSSLADAAGHAFNWESYPGFQIMQRSVYAINSPAR
jgi:hypothetical protein